MDMKNPGTAADDSAGISALSALGAVGGNLKFSRQDVRERKGREGKGREGKGRVKTLLRPCPICAAKQGEILHTQKFILPDDNPLPRAYDVVSCVNCGFVYADTGVGQQVYDAYYTRLSKYEDSKSSGSGSLTKNDLERIAIVVRELEKICPDKNSAILDVGCANGGILKKLKEDGYLNLAGMDLSKKCVANVLDSGIYCARGSLFEAKVLLEQKKFDCIVLSHVMEHLYDLGRAFETCSALLKERGRLYVEVPDAGHYADYHVVPYYYFDTEHINHFDEAALSNIGALCGFSKQYAGHKALWISEQYSYPALFMVFERKSESAFSFSTHARISMENHLKWSACHNFGTDVVHALAKTQEELIVFGAGNFTFRLLASTELAQCDIRAFVDNDSNKHGHFLAGKPIVAPEILKAFKGTLLLCSAFSEQNIIDQIREINPEIQIRVLK